MSKPAVAISGKTRVAAVLGWPVEHSRSPAMLNAAFAVDQIDAVLIPIGVPPDGLKSVVAALRAMNVLGASVTLPHKVAVAGLCDELSPEARAIGAVNCLQFTEGRLVGHNTDCDGFVDGLVAAGFELRGKRAIVLGAGGAARAVAHGLRGGRALEVVARRPAEVVWAKAWPWTDEQLRDCFSRADLVVDCTSASLGDDDAVFADALPLDALPAHAWVTSLIYNRKPKLLERASERGHSTLDGKPMLVHQGARAFHIWTGLPAPVDVMARALEASLA
ncbi:MAG TPA: shikimate dehydrogenase [Kofleriaceae bacterium]|nr:shikimate dehydrogenase [Kofleriaceae bacterium]